MSEELNISTTMALSYSYTLSNSFFVVIERSRLVKIVLKLVSIKILLGYRISMRILLLVLLVRYLHPFVLPFGRMILL